MCACTASQYLGLVQSIRQQSVVWTPCSRLSAGMAGGGDTRLAGYGVVRHG